MSTPTDILSQDEINALLVGVNSGAVPIADAPISVSAQPFDMSAYVRSVRGRMPTLHVINDRMVRQLRAGIHSLLGRTPAITVSPTRALKCSEYLQTLRQPSSLNFIKLAPLRGTCLVMFDSRLVFAVVDSFFGGTGQHTQVEGRDFTPTELRLIQRLLQQVLADIDSSWAPVVTLQPEFIGSESNPNFVNLAAPTEVLLVTAFRVELDGMGGELHLTLPYALLEPIREQLDSDFTGDPAARDDRWAGHLRAHAEDVEIEMVPVLGRSTVTLEKLLSLKAGDMIPCDFEGDAMLLAQGIPAVRGKYCSSRGKQAIQVRELLLGRQD